MENDERLEEHIKRLLVERLFLKMDPAEIEDDKPIMEAYGVDSVGVMEVVVGLEEDFGVTFAQDEEFDIEQFRTIRSIADYVRRKSGR